MDSHESFSARRDFAVKATSNFMNRRTVDGFRVRSFGEIFQFSQANTETQHQTRFIYTSFPIHYSSDILIFHALQCEALETSLNRAE